MKSKHMAKSIDAGIEVRQSINVFRAVAIVGATVAILIGGGFLFLAATTPTSVTETTVSQRTCGPLGNRTPGHVNEATIYQLQNNVKADGTCFTIIADNVTLDLNGNTVTYAEKDVSGHRYGVAGLSCTDPDVLNFGGDCTDTASGQSFANVKIVDTSAGQTGKIVDGSTTLSSGATNLGEATQEGAGYVFSLNVDTSQWADGWYELFATDNTNETNHIAITVDHSVPFSNPVVNVPATYSTLFQPADGSTVSGVVTFRVRAQFANNPQGHSTVTLLAKKGTKQTTEAAVTSVPKRLWNAPWDTQNIYTTTFDFTNAPEGLAEISAVYRTCNPQCSSYQQTPSISVNIRHGAAVTTAGGDPTFASGEFKITSPHAGDTLSGIVTLIAKTGPNIYQGQFQNVSYKITYPATGRHAIRLGGGVVQSMIVQGIALETHTPISSAIFANGVGGGLQILDNTFTDTGSATSFATTPLGVITITGDDDTAVADTITGNTFGKWGKDMWGGNVWTTGGQEMGIIDDAPGTLIAKNMISVAGGGLFGYCINVSGNNTEIGNKIPVGNTTDQKNTCGQKNAKGELVNGAGRGNGIVVGDLLNPDKTVTGVHVHDNMVNVTSSCNIDGGGVGIRLLSGTTNDEVDNNTVGLIADTCGARAFQIDGSFFGGTLNHNVHDNQFTARWKVDDYYMQNSVPDRYAHGGEENLPADAAYINGIVGLNNGTVFTKNTFTGDTTGGFVVGPDSAVGVKFVNNTFNRFFSEPDQYQVGAWQRSASYTNFAAYRFSNKKCCDINSNDLPAALGFSAIDSIFGPNTDLSAGGASRSPVPIQFTGDGSAAIDIGWTTTVIALDNGGQPVTDAQITITDEKGGAIFSGPTTAITDRTGHNVIGVEMPLLEDRWLSGTSYLEPAHHVYTIKAVKSGLPNGVATYTPTAAATLNVVMAPSSFVIVPSAGTNGTIAPSTTTVVNRGANSVFTMTPNTGYHLASVIVDGNPAATVSPYQFTNVTADHTIAASFAVNTATGTTQYTISSTAGTGGYISPAGNVRVSSGVSQTFTITPKSGYQVDDVRVDGVSKGPLTKYIFPAVNQNHTIAATFLQISGTGGGSSTVSVPDALSVVIIQPANNTLMNPGRVSLASAIKNNSGATTVRYYSDGQVIGSSNSSPFLLNWDASTAGLTSHALVARATDAAGHVAVSPTVTITFTKNTVPPGVSLTNPSKGARISGKTSIAAAPSGSGTVVSVIFYRDNGVRLGNATRAPYMITLDVNGWGYGNHQVYAVANILTAGNVVGYRTLTTAVVVDPYRISITQPRSGTKITGKSATFKVKVAGSMALKRVQYLDGKKAIGTVLRSPYTFKWNTAKVKNGNHTITARILDVRGKVVKSTAIVVKIKH